MAFSNEKHQCLQIQKKYLKTIGHFSESLDVLDPILQKALFLTANCLWLSQYILQAVPERTEVEN
jgi:hypothetical protein